MLKILCFCITGFLFVSFTIGDSEICRSVPALGRTARFGDVYDARTNKFTDVNVLNKKLNESLINRIDNPNTKYTYSFASRESQKLEDFDIHGEINVQICTGALKIKGAAKYATNSNYNNKVVQYSQILKTTTSKETFNWKSNEAKEYLDLSRQHIYGTHVVVGIQYGGSAVVTLQKKVTNESSIYECRGNLSLALNVPKFPKIPVGEIGGSGSTSRNNSNCLQGIKVSLEADVVSDDNSDITTIEGVKTFMEKFGGQLLKYNGKKGVQISFDLVPINVIAEYLNSSNNQNITYVSLPDNYTSYLNSQLSNTEEIIEEFYGIYYELEENKIYFTKKEQKWWAKQKSSFDKEISVVYQKINTALFQYHNAEIDGQNLTKATHVSHIKKFVDVFHRKSLSNLLFKLDYVKNAEMNNVVYIHDIRDFENIKRNQKKFYVCILPSANFTIFEEVLNKFVEKAFEKSTVHLLLNADVFPYGIEEQFGIIKSEKYPYYQYLDTGYSKILQMDKGNKLPTFVNISVGFRHDECKYPGNTHLYSTLLYQKSILPAKNSTNFCAQYKGVYPSYHYEIQIYQGQNDSYDKNVKVTTLIFNMPDESKYYDKFEISMKMNSNAMLQITIQQKETVLSSRYIQYYFDKKKLSYHVYESAEEEKLAESVWFTM